MWEWILFLYFRFCFRKTILPNCTCDACSVNEWKPLKLRTRMWIWMWNKWGNKCPWTKQRLRIVTSWNACVRVCVWKRCSGEGTNQRMKFKLCARGKVLEIEEPGQTYAQTHWLALLISFGVCFCQKNARIIRLKATARHTDSSAHGKQNIAQIVSRTV